MITLDELIERVEKATGPDREVDGDIAYLADAVPISYPTRVPNQRYLWSDGGVGLTARNWLAPPYTSSLDAIVGLIEAKLPGCMRRIQDDPDGDGATVTIVLSDGALVSANAATWPLALCAAFLKALRALQRRGMEHEARSLSGNRSGN